MVSQAVVDEAAKKLIPALKRVSDMGRPVRRCDYAGGCTKRATTRTTCWTGNNDTIVEWLCGYHADRAAVGSARRQLWLDGQLVVRVELDYLLGENCE